MGFRLLHGLGRAAAEAIAHARSQGPFVSFADFVRRTGLRRPALQKLARADAFGSLKLDRRSALWHALAEDEPLPLFETSDEGGVESGEERRGDGETRRKGDAAFSPPLPVSPSPRLDFLPPMEPLQEVLADYGSAGLSLKQHPISFLRPRLDQLDVTAAAKLPEMPADCWLKVAGIVLLRQRPSTASGITFVTLEDETGMVNLIIRQQIWERYRRVARSALAYLAEGTLQRDGEVIHVLVARLEDLSESLAALQSRSRDFR